MNNAEAAKRIADSLDADAKRPGEDRFAEMVERGVIDRDGRVLVKGPNHYRLVAETRHFKMTGGDAKLTDHRVTPDDPK